MLYESNFLKGQLKYLILKSLENKPLHGYGIIKKIEEETKGTWKPTSGAVYPALSNLTKSNFIKIKTENIKGRKKKIYSITREGQSYYNDQRGNVELIEKTILEYYKENDVLENQEYGDIINMFTMLNNLIESELKEFKGTLLEFLLLFKERKISKQNEKQFKKNLNEFLKKVKEINKKSKTN